MKFVGNLFNIMQDNCKTVKSAKNGEKSRKSKIRLWIIRVIRIGFFIRCQQFSIARKFAWKNWDLLLFNIFADLTLLLGSKNNQRWENSENSNLILHKFSRFLLPGNFAAFVPISSMKNLKIQFQHKNNCFRIYLFNLSWP